MSDKPVAWMIVQPGCEVGPVETMESTALRKAIDCPPGTAVVPLYARPEGAVVDRDAIIEECAVACEQRFSDQNWASEIRMAAATCAEAVRRLKSRLPQREQSQ